MTLLVLRFWRGRSFGLFLFRLPLDVAGGVPFARLGGAGPAIALALATSRLAHLLVTCHWSQVTVFELGLLDHRKSGGDSRGNRPFVLGTNSVNGGRVAERAAICHEKNGAT
jgi:hypothetical protein